MYVFSVRLVDKTSLKTKARDFIGILFNDINLGKSYIISLTIITSVIINLILTKGNKYE